MTVSIPSYQQRVNEDLDLLLQVLPTDIRSAVEQESHGGADLLEIVMDLGRAPEARFADRTVDLMDRPVCQADIDSVTERVAEFGQDNRAGVERTLHRISAIRNRSGRIIGLTCRVGRAIYGTIDIMRDVAESGRSILILGRPGVGKTTKLREVARVLSETLGRRVVIVDTSNEIAGDGDIPHPAIGRARRMQVAEPGMQHAVMIEAVENHMPEVIVIDEIGTEQEAFAARTIAERGVQLVGTAHGNTLENLLVNPTLSDLVGGIQVVTLGDEEARRRGTQKTVLERKAPPTFDVVIEMLEQDRMAIHHDVSRTVDNMLRGNAPRPEIRERRDGSIRVLQEAAGAGWAPEEESEESEGAAMQIAPAANGAPCPVVSLFPYGVSRNRLEKAIRDLRVPARVSRTIQDADVVLALKSHYRRDGGRVREALALNKPTWSVRSNTQMQIEGVLRQMFAGVVDQETDRAIQDVDRAIAQVRGGAAPVDLEPQSSTLRRLQHQRVEDASLRSRSVGDEPNRRLRVSEI